MKTEKTSLIGKSLEGLVKICEDNDVKSFRAKQLFNWLYRNKVNDFDAFNNLPKELITFLRSEYCRPPLPQGPVSLDFCIA